MVSDEAEPYERKAREALLDARIAINRFSNLSTGSATQTYLIRAELPKSSWPRGSDIEKMLKFRIVLFVALLVSIAVPSVSPQQMTVSDPAVTYRSTTPINIDGIVLPYPSTINVSGGPANIGSLTVKLYSFWHQAPDEYGLASA